jgi:hypothetical protein
MDLHGFASEKSSGHWARETARGYMPWKKLSVVNPHDKKTESYEGVLLEELLRKAGVPQGESLRGSSMATYVLAEAADDTVLSSPWLNWIPGFSILT